MRISDWSSDVCSSDLGKVEKVALHRRRRAHLARHRRLDRRLAHVVAEDVRLLGLLRRPRQGPGAAVEDAAFLVEGRAHRMAIGGSKAGDIVIEIGRASWRERVCQYV